MGDSNAAHLIAESSECISLLSLGLRNFYKDMACDLLVLEILGLFRHLKLILGSEAS